MQRIVAAVAGLLVAGWAAPALAVVHVFVKEVRTNPKNVMFQAGTKVELQCEWGWNLTWPKTTGPGHLIITETNMTYGQGKELVTHQLEPLSGAGSSVVKVQWEPKGPGSRLIACGISFKDDLGLGPLKETEGGDDNSRSLELSIPGTYFPTAAEVVRRCAHFVDVWLELDAATVAAPGGLAFQSAKKKTSANVFKAQSAPGSVQCAYRGAGGATVMYAFQCTKPKKHPDDPWAFICTK